MVEKYKDRRKMFITGFTSLRQNAMELENLGNYVIIEPMFQSLRRSMPDAEVVTTLQLSQSFCDEHRIKVLRERKYWTYNLKNMMVACGELGLSFLHRLFKKIGFGSQHFLFTERLREMSSADIIVDFSGDMYGDNALNRYQFITAGILIPCISKQLEKKLYSIASSPGPFSSSFKYKWAKRILRKFDLIATREPISRMLLNGIGIAGDHVKVAPCFSFGFKPKLHTEWDKVLQQEKWLQNKEDSKPVIGFIISNLNMISGHANKWPRPEEDFKPFLKLIEFLVTELSAEVCLFSHRHKVDENGHLAAGFDQQIANRIIELVPDEWKGNVFTINGLYDASTLNRIIGHFDMLISGRIHGAIQGVSQYVPTVIIDYGLEPKAHKLKGLALLAGLYEYVCDPKDDQAMIEASRKMWEERENMRTFLAERVPQIVADSEAVWEWIKVDRTTRTGEGTL